jgi:hypothetical protein
MAIKPTLWQQLYDLKINPVRKKSPDSCCNQYFSSQQKKGVLIYDYSAPLIAIFHSIFYPMLFNDLKQQ